jgi:hypothetical protein
MVPRRRYRRNDDGVGNEPAQRDRGGSAEKSSQAGGCPVFARRRVMEWAGRFVPPRALSRGLDERLRSTLKAIRNEPSLLGQLKTVLLRLPDLFKPLLQTRHLGNSTSWARSCRVLRGGAALLRMPPMWRQGCADDDAQPCRRVLSLQGMWTPLA